MWANEGQGGLIYQFGQQFLRRLWHNSYQLPSDKKKTIYGPINNVDFKNKRPPYFPDWVYFDNFLFPDINKLLRELIFGSSYEVEEIELFGKVQNTVKFFD